MRILHIYGLHNQEEVNLTWLDLWICFIYSGIYFSLHLLVVLPSMLVLFSNASLQMIEKIADLALNDLTWSLQLAILER